MIKLNKEDRFYFQKKGIIYFLFLIVLDMLCFKFLFGLDSLYVGFFIDLLIFIISGPVVFLFVGHKGLSVALSYMLAPLPFLFFVKKEKQFKIFKIFFLVYWIAWGIFLFLAFINS